MATTDNGPLVEARFAHILDRDSDFTIKCGATTFHVHRVILRKNAYFATLLSSKFKESRSRELTATAEDPHLVELMLALLYGATGSEVEQRLLDYGIKNTNNLYHPAKWFSESELPESLRIHVYDTSSDTDPTLQESKAAAGICLEYLRFINLLDKYQLDSCHEYFHRGFYEILIDAWSHEDVLKVIVFAYSNLPETRLNGLIHTSLAGECSARLDMLWSEPLLHDLIRADRYLHSNILAATLNPVYCSTITALPKYCSSSSCRRTRHAEKGVRNGVVVDVCTACGKPKTLSERKQRLWPHLSA